MNQQESIKRMLKEEKDRTKLIKKIIDFSNIVEYEHFCGVDIINPEERTDQYNFLNKNNIPFLIKVYFIGGPNSKVWPRTQRIRNKELNLIDNLRSHINSFLPFNIEIWGTNVNTCDGYDKLMKRKYSTDELQESIKKILREEVERKYIKPSPKSEKLIYGILNKLFSGADMYYDKVSNVRHDFEFCKNGRQIATFIIYLDNDDAREDKRSPTERNFREGMVQIYSETINDILKHIPIRRNYLKHIIDEWFEETYLDMINKKMGRNDITIDTIDELPNRPDVCVPPQTKPDEITDEVMIKYIMKNTLFTKKDIVKNESEEPGWIENLYLKKLRNEKHNELRWSD